MIITFGSVATLIVLAFYVLRIAMLYANAKTLLASSNTLSRDYYLGAANNPPVNYVALGDSATQGTGVAQNEDTYVHQVASVLANRGYYVHVINLAKSGAKTQDLIATQLPMLSAQNPDYVTLTIGTNDATHFTPLPQYEARLKQIINALDRENKAVVLMANTMDARTFPALPPFYAPLAGLRAQQQNSILKKHIDSEKSTIKIIDLYGAGKLRASENRAYYAADLFHPASAGYLRWSELFIKEIDSADVEHAMPQAAAKVE